jgi:hypothetical protein
MTAVNPEDTINLESAKLIIDKLKSEGTPVLASFVAVSGGLQFSMRGRIVSDENGRIVVSNRPKSLNTEETMQSNRPIGVSELAFEIDDKCSFHYKEPKDYAPELKNALNAIKEVTKGLLDDTTIANLPGYVSGLNIWIPDRGRISLLELAESAES